nr:hypothetical protein [Amycolatopsis taiwanensis]
MLLLGAQRVVPLAQPGSERIVRVGILRLPKQVVLLAFQVSNIFLKPRSAVLALSLLSIVDLVQSGSQDPHPVVAEQAVREGCGDRGQQRVFPDVNGAGMVTESVHPAAVVVLGPAAVVVVPAVVVAKHAAAAPAEHAAAQDVGALRVRVAVLLAAVPRSAPSATGGVKFVEHPLRDQRLVGWLDRPHPHLRRVVNAHSPTAAPRAAVVDLVAGVFRILENVRNRGLRPGSPGAPTTWWLGRRMRLEIGVETFSDRVESELLVVPPFSNQGYRLGPCPIRFQPSLGQPLLGLHGVGMAVFLRLVPIAGLTDVVALSHVGAGATPGLLQHVEYFVLGHRLIDPPLQDLLGPSAG